jgi:hypothetical protein
VGDAVAADRDRRVPAAADDRRRRPVVPRGLQVQLAVYPAFDEQDIAERIEHAVDRHGMSAVGHGRAAERGTIGARESPHRSKSLFEDLDGRVGQQQRRTGVERPADAEAVADL